MTQPNQVETTPAAGNATTGASAPVETPAQSVPATTQTPAPVTYTEADVKAAAERARREAQAEKDRETARLHREYQQQLRAAAESGKRRVQAAAQAIQSRGDPEQAVALVDVFEKAEAFDRWQSQQAQAQQWHTYVANAAQGAGLEPGDPRIQNAVSAEDLAAKIAAAVRADERAAIEAARERAVEAEKRALEARAASGELDTLGGNPAGAVVLTADKYKQEMLAARGKGMEVGRAIKEKYRKAGVDVDHIPLTR